jgi:hypothetical protein
MDSIVLFNRAIIHLCGLMSVAPPFRHVASGSKSLATQHVRRKADFRIEAGDR